MKAILIVILCLSLSSVALSLSAAISSPELGFPEGASKETVSEVLDFLTKEVTFLDGNFINEFSHQSYAASTEKVSALITLLQSKGFVVKMAFFRAEGSKAAFNINHAGEAQGTLTVSINLAAPEFDPGKLKFTVYQGSK